MTKDEVAAALDEIGTLLELKGENTFRTNAYHNAARIVQQLPGDLKQLSGLLSLLRRRLSTRRAAPPRSASPSRAIGDGRWRLHSATASW